MAEDILAFFIIGAVVSGLVGVLLGSSVNRGGAGFFLGFFLGPIGWIIVLLLPRETSNSPQPQAQTQTPKERPPRDLASDAYKIWLGKKYKITRNELFDNFECDEKLFASLDEALKYADGLEAEAREAAKAMSAPRPRFEQVKVDLGRKNISIRMPPWGSGYVVTDEAGDHRLTWSELVEYWRKNK